MLLWLLSPRVTLIVGILIVILKVCVMTVMVRERGMVVSMTVIAMVVVTVTAIVRVTMAMVAVAMRVTVIEIAMRVTANHESYGLVTVIVRVIIRVTILTMVTEITMVILSVTVSCDGTVTVFMEGSGSFWQYLLKDLELYMLINSLDTTTMTKWRFISISQVSGE